MTPNNLQLIDSKGDRDLHPNDFVAEAVRQVRQKEGDDLDRLRSVRVVDGENLVLFTRDWPAQCVSSPQRHVEPEPPGFEVLR
jgi:hypothetical protein